MSCAENPGVSTCHARPRLHHTRRLEPRGHRPRPGSPTGSDIAGRGYAFTTRATARYQMSDFAGAIADCDAALKLDPRDEQALRIRAFAHAGQGTASSTGGAGSMPDALHGLRRPRPGRRMRREV